MSTSVLKSNLTSHEKEAVSLFLDAIEKQNEHQPCFLQSVIEVAEHVIPYTLKNRNPILDS